MRMKSFIIEYDFIYETILITKGRTRQFKYKRKFRLKRIQVDDDDDDNYNNKTCISYENK